MRSYIKTPKRWRKLELFTFAYKKPVRTITKSHAWVMCTRKLLPWIQIKQFKAA